MDPNETLRQIAVYITDGYYENARDDLEAYAAWRAKGGFEPAGGDATAAQLREQLLALRR